MGKNSTKIKDGIRTLAGTHYEIISGTMVAGSLNTDQYTIDVLPTGDTEPIEGVMLNAITENGNGLVLFPKDGSNVIIGSIDGPGEWTLIKANAITKAMITIDDVIYEMDSTEVKIQNGGVVFDIGASVFKMNTTSESLFQLLKDCFTYITELTVPTSSGPSGIPINSVDFTSLLTRLNNLLAS